MECQPRLNGKCKPVLYCISSFEKVFLWKVIRYSCQFFYLLFYNFLELHLTLWEKDFCLKFSFFNRFTQIQAPSWPKSATLLCLIVRGGGVNKMHQWGNYKWSWGIFSQSFQFDPPPTIKHKRVSVTIVCTPPFFFKPPTKFSGAWQDLKF